ncbi:transposase [uncultured Secundilactobacillus sp.]|uniref:IS110 family transposase n=1 Tax=uncultured Secundilactobacillus sp. TaxID=2813935 RepID=UPI002589909C|nr:transposase [uncultured Secundilactobacillus sp.]
MSRGRSSCALLYDHRVVTEFPIVHNKSGLSNLQSVIKNDPGVLPIFETTGVYSRVLAQFFNDLGIAYLEINPLEASIRMAGLRRQKTDRSDAIRLALLGIN